jgi:hypothetical protein
MTDPDAAQRAREWLEGQLADLGRLRNATLRDHDFKTWRQQTLTVIQRVWPGESRRIDRFRRIPFSPPMPHPTDQQVREYFGRGWGEAGVLLRDLIGEINLLGLPRIPAAGTYAGSETEAAMGSMPALDNAPVRLPGVGSVPMDADPSAVSQSGDHGFGFDDGDDPGADVGRAMDRLLGNASVHRAPALASPPVPVGAAPEPGSTAAELMRLAGDLEALGLSPAQAVPARAALLALARSAQSEVPPWELVARVLGDAGSTPALARRVLPLLLEFVAKAA